MGVFSDEHLEQIKCSPLLSSLEWLESESREEVEAEEVDDGGGSSDSGSGSGGGELFR